MYNIRARVPGIFCLNLEDGSVNLRPGQIVNLELMCSRRWIESDSELQSLINRHVIQVIFDSTKDKVPNVNLTTVSKKIRPAATIAPLPARVAQSRTAPVGVIVGLPTPVSDTEPVVIDLTTNVVTNVKTEVKVSAATLTAENVTKRYAETEMRRMNLNDLKLIAVSLGITVTPPISKLRLIKTILKLYEGNADLLVSNM